MRLDLQKTVKAETLVRGGTPMMNMALVMLMRRADDVTRTTIRMMMTSTRRIMCTIMETLTMITMMMDDG